MTTVGPDSTVRVLVAEQALGLGPGKGRFLTGGSLALRNADIGGDEKAAEKTPIPHRTRPLSQ
jgi:hypothetical protein